MSADSLTAGEKKLFTTMLFLDEIRGEHSTGVVGLNTNGELIGYKRALKAADFIQLKGYATWKSAVAKVMVGHNRYATMGAKDDNNAHPFTHRDVSLTHNGTLKTKSDVNKDEYTFDTDSETITWAFATDSVVDVLERLNGAYALAWINKADNTINLARNDERPLFIGKTTDGIVWASEKAIIELAASHSKVRVEDIQELPVGEWRSWTIGKMKEGYEVTEFTPKKPVMYVPPRRHHTGTTGSTTVGRNIWAWVTDIKTSGFFTGATETGESVIGMVPKGEVDKALMMEDPIVRGKIASTSRKHDKGGATVTHNLSSIGITIEEATVEAIVEETEKKCYLCHTSVVESDNAEIHYGSVYHSDCLDAGYQDLRC